MKIKGRTARNIFRFLVLAAALYCWVCALVLSGELVKAAGSVSFHYGVGGVSSAAVEKMLEEESVPFAAWLQTDGQTVGEPAFSRETGVYLLKVAGDAELVLPSEALLCGFLPVRGGTDTCAVDAATAYALWGGTDVIGEALLHDGREYFVTGVFSRPENTVLLQSGPENDKAYPFWEIAVSGLNASGRQAEEFRLRHSLPEPDILTNHVERAAMLRQIALLPAPLLAALLLRRMLRRIIGKPASLAGRACFGLAMAAGIALTAWAVGFSPIIPAAAIPGRWSDFSFWPALVEALTRRARAARAISRPVFDLLRWREPLLYSGGATLGFLITGRRAK